MNTQSLSDTFYADLPVTTAFDALADPSGFTELPDDWIVGTADIVDSTGLIEAGQYKTVNMVGAAVISAVMNALEGEAFPFIFGGDGAGFAVWPGAAETVRAALGRTRRWAEEEFGITLRAALVPAHDCAAAGRTVRVARYAASDHADYAMFAGGGLSWAEARMKAGAYAVALAPPGASPDLTGLACRWAHMSARNGSILSLVMLPQEGVDSAGFTATVAQITGITRRLEREGHPAPVAGPGAHWPPEGAMLEAKARRREGPLRSVRRKVLFEALIALFFLRGRFRLGGFDARHYVKTVVENADFRKFDDGLKMTIDCDADTRAALVDVLDRAEARGIIRYGLSDQSEAMMTCIVPSATRDDHVHFIDGAAGGYTLAASQMKAQG